MIALNRRVVMNEWQANPEIKSCYDDLRKCNKSDLIRQYPSRLDMSHVKSEPKEVIISAILEAKFGRRKLSVWNGKN